MTQADSKRQQATNATIDDVAAHFGVSVRTVWRWVKDTDIPHRRIGTITRFNLTEVDEWSRGGRNGDTDGSE